MAESEGAKEGGDLFTVLLVLLLKPATGGEEGVFLSESTLCSLPSPLWRGGSERVEPSEKKAVEESSRTAAEGLMGPESSRM